MGSWFLTNNVFLTKFLITANYQQNSAEPATHFFLSVGGVAAPTRPTAPATHAAEIPPECSPKFNGNDLEESQPKLNVEQVGSPLIVRSRNKSRSRETNQDRISISRFFKFRNQDLFNIIFNASDAKFSF